MAIKKDLKGKVYADKGYISKKLFDRIYSAGLQIITGIKRNMKNYLIHILDKIMLNKRFIIETIFGYLKEILISNQTNTAHLTTSLQLYLPLLSLFKSIHINL